MRFIHAIALNLLLVSLCAALPVNDDNVQQQMARVQSARPINVGPVDPVAVGGSADDGVAHAQTDSGKIDSAVSSSTHDGTNTNVDVHQNPPPSIPIVHPAVNVSDGTAAAPGSVTNSGIVSNNNTADSVPLDLLSPTACDPGGECVRLGESIVSAGEGQECRALLITGKCSSKCLISLKEAAEHKLWGACVKRCVDTDLDIVTGAAERLVELCQVRQPTLLDASKEALQIVAAAPGAGRVMQAFFILSVLFAGITFCYRRKSNLRLFFQKRLKRRSSERSIV